MPRRIIRITGRQLEPELRRRLAADTELLRRVAYEVVLRGEAWAVEATVAEGVFDTGQFSGSWKGLPLPDGAELRNDAPYAGVLEWGRRPGRPGPPYQPIYEWVVRKLVGNGIVAPEDAEDVAWAIRNKLHVEGSEPRHLLRDTVAQMEAWFPDEARRALRRQGE